MADADEKEPALSLEDIGKIKGGRVRDPFGPEPTPDPPRPVGPAPLPDQPAPERVDTPRPEPLGTGMGWLRTDGRMGLRPPPDAPELAPEPDTSAYRRPSAEPPMGHVLSPRVPPTANSPLEGALSVPVGRVPVGPRDPVPEPEPAAQAPIPWITVLSGPGPGQVCPVCKGPLRAVRSSREERLEMTWFRLEWMEIERCWADCPKHPSAETVAFSRPTFTVPDSRVGNGLLARVLTWRFQDHMPIVEIARLLTELGLKCSERRVAGWIDLAHVAVAPVAAALRAKAQGGKQDELGVLFSDGRREGRLRASERGSVVAFHWTAGGDGPRPDAPEERARRVLLDARGWSHEGRQATLRRALSLALVSRRDSAARLLWLFEELRAAPDGATERAHLARINAILAAEQALDPRMKAISHTLAAFGTEGLCRFDPQGRPAAPPPRPENARAVLPRWFIGAHDGSIEAIADWLTVIESCRHAGVSPWRYLRDLLQATAEGPVKTEAWLPEAQR